MLPSMLHQAESHRTGLSATLTHTDTRRHRHTDRGSVTEGHTGGCPATSLMSVKADANELWSKRKGNCTNKACWQVGRGKPSLIQTEKQSRIKKRLLCCAHRFKNQPSSCLIFDKQILALIQNGMEICTDTSAPLTPCHPCLPGRGPQT